MVEHAPAALSWLGSRVRPDLGGALSGIVGDSAHTYGYHRARNRLPRSDYSVQLSEDRLGNGEAACGIDMSFSDSKMRLYTGRLRTAADRNDPRIRFLREFYGTLDSRNVYGRTHNGSRDSTWERSNADSTHLWHIHISILRQYSNDQAKMRGLLDVLLGKLLTNTTPLPATTPGGNEMWFAQVKDQRAIYKTDGFRAQHVTNSDDLAAMLKAGFKLVVFPTLERMKVYTGPIV